MRKTLILSAAVGCLALAPQASFGWTVQKGAATYPTIAPNTQKPSNTFYIRDGRFSVLTSNESSYPFMIFYPGYQDFRLMGTGPGLEDMKVVSPKDPIYGGESTANTWFNGGRWLMSVHRQSGQNLIGFAHAEDHGYPHIIGKYGNQIAWMSIAVTYSSDNGKTWDQGQRIITDDDPQPPTPEWGGVNNPDAIWDAGRKRWNLYYGDGEISMATSTDPMGARGTWFKYYNGSFSEPGVRGHSSPLKCLDSVRGTLPSVHWNTYLARWMMAYQSYTDKSIYISSSTDGVTWECPRKLVAAGPGEDRRSWYPTLVGDSSTKVGGQKMTLYYLDMTSIGDGKHERQVVKVPLTFQR